MAKDIVVGDESGAVVLAEIPAVLPREVLPMRDWEDRARLAAHITRVLFTVSPRTLETWPVRSIIMNKRALLNTKEAMAYAQKQLKQAEKSAVRGGSGAGVLTEATPDAERYVASLKLENS